MNATEELHHMKKLHELHNENELYTIVLFEICQLQAKKIKAIPITQKDDVQHMLTFIETTLGGHWGEYDGYKELEARNTNMAKLLKAQGNKKDHGEITLSSVVKGEP